jgi:hypothetical protein
VWVKRTEWTKWEGLSKDERHPNDTERYLNPTETMFEWSDVSAFFSDKSKAQLIYGREVAVAEVVKKIEIHLSKNSTIVSKRGASSEGDAKAPKKMRTQTGDDEGE